MSQIHPSAIIHDGAELDEGVTVGPWAIVGPQARIGAGCSIGAHALVDGNTTLGPDNEVFPYAVVGSRPQDKKFKGEDVALVIGRGNTIREFVTINPGTGQGGGSTTIGDGNLLMAYVHIAHDCHVANHCVLSNSAQLAGHVIVEDRVIVGGMSGVHQFVRLGTGSMVGGGSMVTLDVPPYCLVEGNRANLHGLNTMGLKRAEMPEETVAALKEIYRVFFRQGKPAKVAAAELAGRDDLPPEAVALVRFVAASERGVCRPRRERSS
jgi:UDP-N-acetylglucosamine acyltransferase